MSNLVFVVHKHYATSLHYDFRLEIKGVLASWAIPKGPTLDPKLKRLAMKVTDHDLKYRHFEGVITQGKYDAGPVMIWDEGTYLAEKEVEKGKRELIKDKKSGDQIMSEGIQKGDIKFFLDGKKLKGSFALVKTRGFPPGKTINAWLLIKHNDKYCKTGYDAVNFDFSAKSKKTLEEIRSRG